MSESRPRFFDNVDSCVAKLCDTVGPELVVGLPLGLGKPVTFVNSLYRHVAVNPALKLEIITALSLDPPGWRGDLDRRLIEPIRERLYGEYPQLEYVTAIKKDRLPVNIDVSEFYFAPGEYLDNDYAQRRYTSVNYTHVVRDSVARGVNVIAHMIAKQDGAEGVRYSLSCNPDTALDIAAVLRQQQQAGRAVAVIGVVNKNLPYMYGDAEVDADFFDYIVEKGNDVPLFGIPNEPVDVVEYMIGLHVSGLIRDGGTLQIGIGKLGDALAYCTELRHHSNDDYREVMDATGISGRFGELFADIGGLGTFDIGLYGASEMFVEAFLRLYEGGVLKRRVYDHPGVQELINEGVIRHSIPRDIVPQLAAKTHHPVVSAREFEYLRKIGVFDDSVDFVQGQFVWQDGTTLTADLSMKSVQRQFEHQGLGDRLKDSAVLHAAFFLGPQSFYDTLNAMDEAERKRFRMCSVSKVNQVSGESARLMALQRRDARFVNTAMMSTLTGAAVSDGLETGQVVSGVGGQYNFVAMGHMLPDARSILALRSTYKKHGKVRSNLCWSYGYITIPRHLRDIVVTEYGLADLRGRSDEDCIKAMLNITDSRFQRELLKTAKRNGKLAPDYEIPDAFRNNLPQRLRDLLLPFKARDLFPGFPYGTDLTGDEIALAQALRHLAELQKRPLKFSIMLLKAVMPKSVPEKWQSCIDRMDLTRPRSFKARLTRNLLLNALRLSASDRAANDSKPIRDLSKGKQGSE